MDKPDNTKWLRVPIPARISKELKMEALRRDITLAEVVVERLGQGPSTKAWTPDQGHKSNPFTD